MVFKPNDEQKKVGKIIWDILISFGYNEISAGAMLGVIQFESQMNPGQPEIGGGGGYGLIQWTPKENLYLQGSQLGISKEECETTEGQSKIIAQGDKTGQWLTGADTRYGPLVIVPLMLDKFKETKDMDVGVENFVAHFARPQLGNTHMLERKESAKVYYQLFTGSPPTTGSGSTTKVITEVYLDNFL